MSLATAIHMAVFSPDQKYLLYATDRGVQVLFIILIMFIVLILLF